VEDLTVEKISNAAAEEDVPAITDDELFRLWGRQKKDTKSIARLTGLSIDVVIRRLTPILMREVELRVEGGGTEGHS